MSTSKDVTDSEDLGSKTLAGEAYNRIRKDIVTGQLEGGDKLRLEALSRRYGIGMSPLREALARLVGDALVVTEGQRGFWVSSLSIAEFEDITNTRALIETEALLRSIQNGDADWEARVRETFATLGEIEVRLTTESGLGELFEEANREFHEALTSACGSTWLLRFNAALYQQSARYRQISLANLSPMRSVHDEHQALADAALSRQGLRACRILEMHLRETADVVRAAMAPDQAKLRVVGG